MTALMYFAVLLFNGCSGKDGAPGAAGPTGAQGNANVQYTIFQMPNANWSWNGSYLTATLNDPLITESIINTGVVLVYVVDSSQDNFQLSAREVHAISATVSQTESLDILVGQVMIQLQNTDGSQPTYLGSSMFKVIVMPSRKPLSNPHINFKDFESVKQAFNLKDK